MSTDSDPAYVALRRALRSLTTVLEPGTRLGDFELESVLGHGGMGSVYAARQVTLGGRRVALKVLSPEFAGDEDRLRFRREAQVLSELHHEHLAEVYGCGESVGHAWYAMQLIDGPSLRNVLERVAAGEDRVDAPTIARWGREVASALAFLHERGLMHRDVKPSNVIVRTDGARDLAGSPCVLVDFGLARSVGKRALTLPGGGHATPGYAAPEQLLGSEVDGRADVFALGVTLHDLLSGCRPDERLPAAAGLLPLVPGERGVDRDLSALVARATDPQPEWRYADGRVLESDLAAWLAGRPVSARRRPVAERLQRWVRNHPAPFVWAAVVGLAVVPLVTLGFWLGPARDRAPPGTALARGDHVESSGGIEGTPGLRGVADPDERLAVVQELARRHGPQAALEACVAELLATGLAGDPVLAGFVAHCVERSETDWTPSVAKHVLASTARLFDLRPVATADRGEALDRIRQVARRVQLAHDDESVRRAAVAVLAACGDVDDVDLLLVSAVEADVLSEGRRVRLEAVRRLALRAAADGSADELDHAAIWRLLAPALERAFALPDFGPALRPSGPAIAHVRCAEVLLALDPAPPGVAAWFPRSVSAWGGDAGGSSDLPRLLAAAGDPRWDDGLREAARRRWERWEPWPVELGRLCGLRERAGFATSSHTVGDDDPDALEMLAEELRGILAEVAAREKAAARDDPAVPDVETVLELFRRGREAGRRPFAPDAVMARTVDGSLSMSRRAPDDGVWGRWDLWEGVRQGDPVHDPVCRAATVVTEPNGEVFLELAAEHDAEVTFPFELSVRVDALELHLHHLAADNATMPDRGEVWLEVLVEGAKLAETRVTRGTWHFTEWQLPDESLAPGRHAVTIRPLRHSTTTWWLRRADLQKWPR